MSQQDRKLRAAEALAIPSIFLIILGLLNVAQAVLSMFMVPAAILGDIASKEDGFGDTLDMVVGLPMTLVAIGASCFIAFGALKMRAVESYGISVAAAILACLPGLSPCCCLGVPFGIWALVILTKAEVRTAFNSQAS